MIESISYYDEIKKCIVEHDVNTDNGDVVKTTFYWCNLNIKNLLNNPMTRNDLILSSNFAKLNPQIVNNDKNKNINNNAQRKCGGCKEIK